MRTYTLFPSMSLCLALAACGDVDVKSACFDNGEHGKLSDGRITRICDCRIKQGGIAKFEPKDQELLARIIAEKSIDDARRARGQELATIWGNTASVCSALK